MNDKSLKGSIKDGPPRIGVTIGDVAGIGPEVVLKALSDTSFQNLIRPVLIGDAKFLFKTGKSLGIDLDRMLSDNKLELIDLKNLPSEILSGKENGKTGRASGEYIEKAVALWREKEIDAIATAPISKAALKAGGYNFPGHTEFLASLSDTRNFAMSFFAEKLRVVLLSTHLPLREAISRVTKTGLIDLIVFSELQLSKLLHKPVRIAVAGLNPHASEGGMFGSEEADEIVPAVDYCRNTRGIDVSGPYSPDTIFLRGFRGEFDAVIACYHDQATIAVKSLSFGSSVNVTLGLPFIRTSVDHGTAIDIAGKGIADHSSMRAAIALAAELSLIQRSTTNISQDVKREQ